jgi:hypothetical protein
MKSVDFEACVRAATIDQAKEWAATDEKFIHCIDTLEISAHDADADDRVVALEAHYMKMLAEADIPFSY